jgi:hypothetical protein
MMKPRISMIRSAHGGGAKRRFHICLADATWSVSTMRFALAYPEEGYHMHDPALWTNWYVALLLFPFMIIALLLRDFLAGRGRRR